MGQKLGGAAVPFFLREAGLPMNTKSPRPRPTYTPSGTLVHPATRAAHAYGARSHYDVILIMTSFATELATPSITGIQTYIWTPYHV